MSGNLTLSQAAGAAVFPLWVSVTLVSVVGYQRPTMPFPLMFSTLQFKLFSLALFSALLIIAAAIGAV